jgi:hypothetical protein
MVAIWGWPTLLGVVTGIGLVSALFSDGGAGDVLAAICLGIPVPVGLLFGWLRAMPGVWGLSLAALCRRHPVVVKPHSFKRR